MPGVIYRSRVQSPLYIALAFIRSCIRTILVDIVLVAVAAHVSCLHFRISLSGCTQQPRARVTMEDKDGVSGQRLIK